MSLSSIGRMTTRQMYKPRMIRLWVNMQAGGHLLLNTVQRQLDDREDRARAGRPLTHAPHERARALRALCRRRAVAVPPGLHGRGARLSPERRARRSRSRARQRQGATGNTGASRPWPTAAAQPDETWLCALAPGERCRLQRGNVPAKDRSPP